MIRALGIRKIGFETARHIEPETLFASGETAKKFHSIIERTEITGNPFLCSAHKGSKVFGHGTKRGLVGLRSRRTIGIGTDSIIDSRSILSLSPCSACNTPGGINTLSSRIERHSAAGRAARAMRGSVGHNQIISSRASINTHRLHSMLRVDLAIDSVPVVLAVTTPSGVTAT